MKFWLFFILFLIFIQDLYAQENLDEGLYFSSHEVIQDKRTSLYLTPESSIDLNKNIVLEFDANFRRGDGYYGNIFKIIADEELNIDLVANLSLEKENFWLVFQDRIIFQFKWSDIPRGDYNKWINFKIKVDSENSELTLSINGYNITKNIPELENVEKLDIVFGKSVYKKFTTTDVCPMTIKSIQIFDNNDLIRNWPLGKHTGKNLVYDNVAYAKAVVENPNWLIDQHVKWKEDKKFKFDNLLGTAIDASHNRIFFINTKAVYIYNIKAQIIDTLTYIENTLNCQSNYFTYNHLKDELIAYSIEEKLYKKFDFKNLRWTGLGATCEETAYLHHNHLISPKDSTLITFGGYGYHTYKSNLFKFFSETDPPRVSSANLSNKINPRYLSSSGILNSDQFLIYGGYGTPSGKQGVSSEYYYDLYSIEFEGFKTTKIWEFEDASISPFVPVSSMVIDNTSDSFYTLLYNNVNYNTTLKLARIGIKEYEMTVFPDSIPYQFLDIKSNVNFFLDPTKMKLYTLTILEDEANLYSLTYPPLLSEDIYQTEVSTSSKFLSYWYYFLLGGILLLIILWYFFRNKTKEKISTLTVLAQEEVVELKYDKSEKIKKSAIYLFGGFQVFDKDGKDITALFTPTLKQLFLLIFITSLKNGKGISSIKLTELLWPNKSEKKARNNRNVNVSKLRILLEKVGSIDLNNENTYWKINLGQTVFCDFVFVQNTLKESSQKNLSDKQIYELLNIISRGEITPDVHTDWIEDFKNETNNFIIDNFLKLCKTCNDHQLLILISIVILKYDPLNEEAIEIKCKSLYAQGKIGLAKQCYNEFNSIYYKILDAKYDKTFREITSEE